MNVANLISHLQTFPPTAEVVVAKNCKGDCFSPLEKIGSGRFIPWNDPPFCGHVGEIITVDKRNQNCVYIIPEA